MGIPHKLLTEVLTVYGRKVSEKHELIHEHITRFISEYYSDFSDDSCTIVISGDRITEIINNYFVDIHRFKERHDMVGDDDWTSNGKIAAFTAKWLIKMKPITVILTGEHDTQCRMLSNYINEIFAVQHIIFLLNHKNRVNPVELHKRLKSELVFEFRQKKFSETQLYMLLESATGFYSR